MILKERKIIDQYLMNVDAKGQHNISKPNTAKNIFHKH